ncbi:MAG: ERCC4 domain-containing protein [Candidatus Omnitrophota bacterium]
MLPQEKYIIKIDFRERDCGVGTVLHAQYGVEVIEEKLPVGDYLIDEEIVVERKTVSDFAQSVVDGRLFKQAQRMKSSFDWSLFIVEGDIAVNNTVNMHAHTIKGALVSIALRWQIPVLFSKNIKETALILWLAGQQRVKAAYDLFPRRKRPPKRLYKQQLYILQGLPQVGPKLAGALLNYFGSVEEVIGASELALRDVDGVGKIKARKIKQIVGSQFKK